MPFVRDDVAGGVWPSVAVFGVNVTRDGQFLSTVRDRVALV